MIWLHKLKALNPLPSTGFLLLPPKTIHLHIVQEMPFQETQTQCLPILFSPNLHPIDTRLGSPQVQWQGMTFFFLSPVYGFSNQGTGMSSFFSAVVYVTSSFREYGPPDGVSLFPTNLQRLGSPQRGITGGRGLLLRRGRRAVRLAYLSLRSLETWVTAHRQTECSQRSPRTFCTGLTSSLK